MAAPGENTTAGTRFLLEFITDGEFKDLLSDPLTPYNQLVEALGYKGELPQSPADQLTASKETTQKRKHAVYTNTVKRKWRLKSMSSLRHQWLSSFLGEHQYFQPGPQRGYPNIQQLCLSRASLEAWAEENKPQKLRTGPNAHLYAHLFVPDLESAKKAFLCIAWGDHDSDYNYMSKNHLLKPAVTLTVPTIRADKDSQDTALDAALLVLRGNTPASDAIKSIVNEHKCGKDKQTTEDSSQALREVTELEAKINALREEMAALEIQTHAARQELAKTQAEMGDAQARCRAELQRAEDARAAAERADLPKLTQTTATVLQLQRELRAIKEETATAKQRSRKAKEDERRAREAAAAANAQATAAEQRRRAEEQRAADARAETAASIERLAREYRSEKARHDASIASFAEAYNLETARLQQESATLRQQADQEREAAAAHRVAAQQDIDEM